MKKELIELQQALRTSPYSLIDIEVYRPLIETISEKERYVKAYGKRLEECRKTRKIPQRELGALVGASYNEIYKIEAAEYKKINVEYFLLFCQYFKCTPEYLLGFEREPITRARIKKEGLVITFWDHVLKLEEQNDSVAQKREKDVPRELVDPMNFYDGLALKKAAFTHLCS